MMQYDWIIIDGYNLLHCHQNASEQRDINIQVARDRLVRFVEKAVQEIAPQATIVFDGQHMGVDEAFAQGPIEVFFSPSDLTADSIIERLVCKYPKPERIIVATDDQAEQHTVLSAGASVMSSRELIQLSEQANKRPIQSTPNKSAKATLGDIFPDIS